MKRPPLARKLPRQQREPGVAEAAEGGGADAGGALSGAPRCERAAVRGGAKDERSIGMHAPFVDPRDQLLHARLEQWVGKRGSTLSLLSEAQTERRR